MQTVTKSSEASATLCDTWARRAESIMKGQMGEVSFGHLAAQRFAFLPNGGGHQTLTQAPHSSSEPDPPKAQLCPYLSQLNEISHKYERHAQYEISSRCSARLWPSFLISPTTFRLQTSTLRGIFHHSCSVRMGSETL